VQPPSLGARVAARFVDGGIVGIPAGSLASAIGLGLGTRVAFVTVVAVAYDTVSVAVFGRTLGKRLFQTAVVDLAQAPVTWSGALTRAVVLLVPLYLPAAVGGGVGESATVVVLIVHFLVVAQRRDDRRGIHDLAAGTRPVANGSAPGMRIDEVSAG
jgi:uncharacterized RDD family membrane protein YckC